MRDAEIVGPRLPAARAGVGPACRGSPLLRLVCLLVLVCGGALPHALAEEVEVATVRFGSARPSNGANGWWEATVVLNVKPPAGAHGQMVARVRVALLLGFELPAPAGGERRTEYYRAAAECVALETGRAEVRFYLPPEIVKRDQLHGAPKFWGVELAAAGRELTPSRGAYSTALATAEQRWEFQSRGQRQAESNDGILQPQFLTPFANDYPRTTPSFVRRDAR